MHSESANLLQARPFKFSSTCSPKLHFLARYLLHHRDPVIRHPYYLLLNLWNKVSFVGVFCQPGSICKDSIKDSKARLWLRLEYWWTSIYTVKLYWLLAVRCLMDVNRHCWTSRMDLTFSVWLLSDCRYMCLHLNCVVTGYMHVTHWWNIAVWCECEVWPSRENWHIKVSAVNYLSCWLTCPKAYSAYIWA